MTKAIVWINSGLLSHFELFQSYGDQYTIIGDGNRKLKESDFVLDEETIQKITGKTQFLYLSHGGQDKDNQECKYTIESNEVVGQATECDFSAAVDSSTSHAPKIIIAPNFTFTGQNIGKIKILGIKGSFTFDELTSENYRGPGIRTKKNVYSEKECSDHEIYSLIIEAVKSACKSSHPTIHISSCYGGSSLVRENSELESLIAKELPNGKLVSYAGNKSVLVRKDKVIFDLLNKQGDFDSLTDFAYYIEKVAIEVPESICLIINGKKILFERPDNLLSWDYRKEYTKLHTDLEYAIEMKFDMYSLPYREAIIGSAFDYCLFDNISVLEEMFEHDSKLGLNNSKYLKILYRIFNISAFNIWDKESGYHKIAELTLKKARELKSDGGLAIQESFDCIEKMIISGICNYRDFELFGMKHVINGLLEEAININSNGILSILTKTDNLAKLIETLGYKELGKDGSILVNKIIDAGITYIKEPHTYAPSLSKDAAVKLSEQLYSNGFSKDVLISAMDKLFYNGFMDVGLKLGQEKLAIDYYHNTGQIIPDIKVYGEDGYDQTSELSLC